MPIPTKNLLPPEMSLRASSQKPFSEQGNGEIPKKTVMTRLYGIKKYLYKYEIVV